MAWLARLERPDEVASLVLSGGLAHAPRWIVLQRLIARITPKPLLVHALSGMYSGGGLSIATQPALRRGFSWSAMAGTRSAVEEQQSVERRGSWWCGLNAFGQAHGSGV